MKRAHTSKLNRLKNIVSNGTKCAPFGLLLFAMLAAPRAQAQSAEDFQRLKSMVEQMQKTIEAQNARIAELATNKAVPPPAPAAAVNTPHAGRLEANSPSIQNMEKVAEG